MSLMMSLINHLDFYKMLLPQTKKKSVKRLNVRKKKTKNLFQVMLDMPSELTKKPLGELPIKVDSKIKPKSSRSENVSVYSAGSKNIELQ